MVTPHVWLDHPMSIHVDTSHTDYGDNGHLSVSNNDGHRNSIGITPTDI